MFDLPWAVGRVRWEFDKRYDQLVDRIYGINTAGIVDCDVTSDLGDQNYYQPTAYRVLRRVFAGLSIEPGDVFADLGCGFGRAVCFAARHSFTKVYGVELSERFASYARNNAKNLKSTAAKKIEIICGSATEFDCRTANTYYLYNPFGPKTLATVLANIKSGARVSGKSVKLLYLGPMHRQLLEDCDWLAKPLEIYRANGHPTALLYHSNKHLR
jgi:SAM-dependent methyltransferase